MHHLIEKASKGLKRIRTVIMVTVFSFSSLFYLMGIAYAGEIEESVYSAIRTSNAQENIAVIVRMVEQPDLLKMKQGFNDTRRRVRSSRFAGWLKEFASVKQGDIRKYLEREKTLGALKQCTPFWIFNGFAISATPKVILALAKRSDVRSISMDRSIPLPGYYIGRAITSPSSFEWNIAKIKAPEVWESGIDGTGVVVGVFDTGVDDTHPDLAGKYRGGNNSWFDPYGDHEHPHDSVGHGTHVAGTIVGGSNGGTSIGIAPGAQWIAAKAWDDYGMSSTSNFHLIFQWFLDPDGNPQTDDAPDVVNNSWGMGMRFLCNREFEADIQAWISAGIIPVFSAGNGGDSPFTGIVPAAYPEVISVGATDIEDRIAEFSSRGPSICDFSVFPTISAPGVDIGSAQPGRHYISFNGTSMACPHVVGTVALMLSANHDLSLDDIKQTLQDTATPLGIITPNNNYGWGLINAYEAVMSVMQ
jgi:subtilisin family serine protease